MRVLVAPDKFKHALSASDVASAIGLGVYSVSSIALIEYCPLADGGEGSGEILAAALDAAPRSLDVHDALHRPRTATWWWNQEQHIAIVELAEAAGLRWLRATERNPLIASTFGVGELLNAARRAGATTCYLAVGGSATVDGGAGCLQALGWQLLDSTGRECAPAVGGGALSRAAQIVPPADKWSMRLIVLADVDAPLLGPRGAAQLYGPQKGAQPLEVIELEAGLAHWAELLARTVGERIIDPLHERFFGAAGGTPVGMALALGAECSAGFEVIARALRLADRIAASDLIITGEGRLDEQTLQGKVVAGVARLAAAAGVPCAAIVGQIAADAPPGLQQSLHLQSLTALHPGGAAPPSPAALADTAADLAHAAAEVILAFVRPRFC